MTLEQRYLGVKERIFSIHPNGAPNITLIAVSKSQSVSAIETLYQLGQRDFGENYVQELIQKAEMLFQRGCKEIRWHFIGHLQTNKVKKLLPWVYAVHTVDSEKLGAELARRWRELAKPEKLPVLIEVNLDRESSKSGVLSEEVLNLSQELCHFQELNLLGLMGIPSKRSINPGISFRKLRELEALCRPNTQGALSMGMSDDFSVAIREGATHLRIGTAIFGERRVESR